VYLIYHRDHGCAYALKTFRDEFIADDGIRERFRKEAEVWIELERHPYIVRAFYVTEVERRLFIGLEYVAPDEQGPNTLEGYLRHSPPDLAQSLRWAIQFCYGMEYAYSRGLRCHRDIKPANIMIARDNTVKITDFVWQERLPHLGLYRATDLNVHEGVVGLSGQTLVGTGFGTPTHMPPEQFTNAASCDERSDVVRLWRRPLPDGKRRRLPFLAPLPVGRVIRRGVC